MKKVNEKKNRRTNGKTVKNGKPTDRKPRKETKS